MQIRVGHSGGVSRHKVQNPAMPLAAFIASLARKYEPKDGGADGAGSDCEFFLALSRDCPRDTDTFATQQLQPVRNVLANGQLVFLKKRLAPKPPQSPSPPPPPAVVQRSRGLRRRLVPVQIPRVQRVLSTGSSSGGRGVIDEVETLQAYLRYQCVSRAGDMYY